MQLKQFGDLLLVYSKIQPRYAPDFADGNVMRFWFQEFGGLELFTFKAALDTCMRTLTAFPSIKQLHDQLGSGGMGMAERAAALPFVVWEGLERNAAFHGDWQAISAHLGADGVCLVERLGGWGHLVDTVEYRQKTTLLAQWRDLAKAITPELVAATTRQRPDLAQLPAAPVHQAIAQAAEAVDIRQPISMEERRAKFRQLRAEIRAR